MKNGSIVSQKSYQFAIRIVNLYKFLLNDKKEFVLSKQVLRSGTAIGALISEGKFAQSKADFINKMYVALKEANETLYWLNLLKDTEYLAEKDFQSIHKDANELVKLLASIVKTSKENLELKS